MEASFMIVPSSWNNLWLPLDLAITAVVQFGDHQLLSYLYANPQKWRAFNWSSYKIATKIYKSSCMMGYVKKKNPLQMGFLLWLLLTEAVSLYDFEQVISLAFRQRVVVSRSWLLSSLLL